MNKGKGASRPIVYLGPSLCAQEAAKIYPACEFRRPIRRGELYRDREKGGALFVVIDGVFMQNEAVSPREIVDVLRDGALVFGASSLGALRAAECWPAGMQGIGLIARLYRMGLLESDDEVAVGIEPESSRALSVALVSVRYALSKAVRKNLIEREAARRVIAAAIEIFYPERRWPQILRQAGFEDPNGRLLAFCSGLDLKRLDAVKAVASLSRRCSADPRLCERHTRRTSAAFVMSENSRERLYDPLFGRSVAELKPDLLRWLVGSGRYRRHFWPIAFAAIRKLSRRPSGKNRQREALALESLLGRPNILADRFWAELESSMELDAELVRFHALRAAAREAARLGLSARSFDEHQARREISIAHGFASWDHLCWELNGSKAWSLVLSACGQLALAKRMRDELFNPR